MVKITNAAPQDFSSTDVLFQTSFWGEFRQKITNQESLYFWVSYKSDENDKGVVFPFLVQARKYCGETYAYAQRAPAILVPEEKRAALLEELADEMKNHLPKETLFLRFDLPWNVPGVSNAGERNGSGSGFRAGHSAGHRAEMLELAMNFGSKFHNLRKAASNHLCPDTVIIDLRPSPEKLLSSMRQQTRNSIRRAYKEEVDFSIYDAKSPDLAEKLEEWHEIYEETAKRKGFFFEKLDYFKTLFECAAKAENSEPRFEEKSNVPLDACVPPPKFYLFTASKNGKTLSGLVLAISAKRAYYMYAASSLAGRGCMPNYGLQWEVIRFARMKGCLQYDLMGIPQDSSKEDPMAGLYIFKTGFGGQKTHFGGAWDFPYDKERYQNFRVNETIMMKK